MNLIDLKKIYIIIIIERRKKEAPFPGGGWGKHDHRFVAKFSNMAEVSELTTKTRMLLSHMFSAAQARIDSKMY